MARDDDIPHGLTGYGSVYKCRCDICRGARAEYLRKHRAANQEKYREYSRRYQEGLHIRRKINMETPFCKRIREIKLQRGYTFEEMALRCKVSRSAVLAWHNGTTRPHPRAIPSIYKALEK